MARPHLHAFPDSLRFAHNSARGIGVPLSRVEIRAFPDGESLVRVKHPAGREAIVVRSLHNPNAKALEVLLSADALRRAGAQAQLDFATAYAAAQDGFVEFGF